MTFKHLTMLFAAASFTLALTSCNDSKNEPDPSGTVVLSYLDFTKNTAVEFDSEGVWNNCYNENTVYDLNYGGLLFSHSANASWHSWYGFCPSKSTSTLDFSSTGDWLNNQWSSITGNGIVFTDVMAYRSVPGAPYMVGCFDTAEDLNAIPLNPSLKIQPATPGVTFAPQVVFVTNTTWSYFAMAKGSDFNQKFEDGSWCRAYFVGVKNGKKTDTVTVNLANGKSILNVWQQVDLSKLGEVDYFYIQMDSTDKSEYGGVKYMNNPAYIVIGAITMAVKLQ